MVEIILLAQLDQLFGNIFLFEAMSQILIKLEGLTKIELFLFLWHIMPKCLSLERMQILLVARGVHHVFHLLSIYPLS